MAMLSSQADYRTRHSNKEPEWSSICNNIFDEYLDTDDLFGFEASQNERSSSIDSIQLFGFSGSSEQSHQTEGTSPVPSWEHSAHERIPEAQQPKAKEPVNFWTKTLRALEQNAAECEQRQQTLRSTKSHPDFLSLGGCPSPPAVPASPTDQSFSAHQRTSRSAANGNRRNVTARSVSRGRPTGVTKSTVAGCVNPYATVRKCSASPPKMMNPSRYRAGFKEIWVDKTWSSAKKYELKVPSMALPFSPPPSARTLQADEFAAFGSPSINPPLPAYDDQLSPLANTFQQAHIHTPIASPGINGLAFAHNSHFDPVPTIPSNAYATNVVPLNDTAPLYPERTSSLAPNKIQTFDFGFDDSHDFDDFNTTSFPTTTHYITDSFTAHDPFGSYGTTVLPSTETPDFGIGGLGISCDPALVSNHTAFPYNATLHSTIYQPSQTISTSHPHTSRLEGPPSTPHRRARSRHRSEHRSQSPSPPATEPRSRRSASKPRRTSRHRRTKSTNATPRNSQNLDKSGFVNFTPQDSNKILGGVAPSGSSKTKARREKEAADKRRRLSQAAVKAVVEAGGDLDTLSKAGLLVRGEEESDALFCTP